MVLQQRSGYRIFDGHDAVIRPALLDGLGDVFEIDALHEIRFPAEVFFDRHVVVRTPYALYSHRQMFFHFFQYQKSRSRYPESGFALYIIRFYRSEPAIHATAPGIPKNPK